MRIANIKEISVCHAVDEIIDKKELIKLNVDYSLCIVTNAQIVHAYEAENNDYYFVDRRIYMECNLSDEGIHEMKARKGLTFDIREVWDIDEVYAIACMSFQEDRRFQYALAGDEREKNVFLREYIKQCKEERCKIVRCCYKNMSIGFLIFKEGEANAEFVLGAMRSDYKNSGSAFFMYEHVVEYLKKKGVNKLYSNISSNNLPSMNLHMKLINGTWKFKYYKDFYIWSREVGDKSKNRIVSERTEGV